MTRFSSNIAQTQKLIAETRAQYFQPLTTDGTPGGTASLAVNGERTVYVGGRKSVFGMRMLMAHTTGLANDSLGADATPTNSVDIKITGSNGTQDLIDLGSVNFNNEFGILMQDEAVGLIGGTWHIAAHVDFVKLFGNPVLLLGGQRLQVTVNETNAGLARWEFFSYGNIL